MEKQKFSSLLNYRAQVVIGDFIQSECEPSQWGKTIARKLYQAFTEFFQKKYNCDCLITETFFGRELNRRGIDRQHTSIANYRVGILLKKEIEIDKKIYGEL